MLGLNMNTEIINPREGLVAEVTGNHHHLAACFLMPVQTTLMCKPLLANFTPQASRTIGFRISRCKFTSPNGWDTDVTVTLGLGHIALCVVFQLHHCGAKTVFFQLGMANRQGGELEFEIALCVGLKIKEEERSHEFSCFTVIYYKQKWKPMKLFNRVTTAIITIMFNCQLCPSFPWRSTYVSPNALLSGMWCRNCDMSAALQHHDDSASALWGWIAGQRPYHSSRKTAFPSDRSSHGLGSPLLREKTSYTACTRPLPKLEESWNYPSSLTLREGAPWKEHCQAHVWWDVPRKEQRSERGREMEEVCVRNAVPLPWGHWVCWPSHAGCHPHDFRSFLVNCCQGGLMAL